MTIPECVPVMTLPNAVLFPRLLLPLHIFEPCYRRMLADCLDGDRMFAVALQKKCGHQHDDECVPCAIATVGIIRACVGQPNGTSNLLLQGLTRVRLGGCVQWEPYRVRRIKPLRSTGLSKPPDNAPLLRAIAEFADARAKAGHEVPDIIRNSMLAMRDADLLPDLACYTFVEDDGDRQKILETLNIAKRQALLVQTLRRQIEEHQFWRKLQGDLPNDHVQFN